MWIVKDIVIFLGLEVYNSDNYYFLKHVFLHGNAQFTFVEKAQLKIISFQNLDHWFILVQTKRLMIPLWIGHCHLCMESHINLHLSNPFSTLPFIISSPLFFIINVIYIAFHNILSFIFYYKCNLHCLS